MAGYLTGADGAESPPFHVGCSSKYLIQWVLQHGLKELQLDGDELYHAHNLTRQHSPQQVLLICNPVMRYRPSTDWLGIWTALLHWSDP